MSELVKSLKSETALINLDGFAGYTDESENQDQEDFAPHARIIQGTRISFTKQAVWVNREKQPLPKGLLLLVANVLRVVQKWGPDGMPAGDPRILKPGEKWPDVEAMNEKCPKSEWRMYFDKLIGPYQRQKVVYLWDPNITLDKYTYAASSNSGMNAVSNLVEKINTQRDFKKVRAYPIVTLESLLWSKRYNTPGPNFIIQDWVELNERGGLVPIAATTPAALTASRPTTAQEMLNQNPGMKPVAAPTGAEATGDKIEF